MSNDEFPKPSTATFALPFDRPALEPADELAPPDRPLVFRHRTVAGVSPDLDTIEFPWYWTRLSHPVLNNNPSAFVFVTPVGVIEIDEENATANLRQNPHAVGVVYRELTGRWYIYNLGLEAMAVGAVFNVVIEPQFG